MYDYIIVGAGSAGCVLAHRLTEDPDVSVLLLEAGGADSAKELRIPAAGPANIGSGRDWGFQTEPQPHLDNDRINWPRGKVLGGSSSINFMIYMRGNPLDYNAWRDAGCPGWGYDDVLPLFKRSENQQRGASEFHGVGGPLDVGDLRTVNPMTDAFVEAMSESGIPYNPDFNGSDQRGGGYYQVTQKKGNRASTATAFLDPVRKRPNLTVRTDTHVTRVLIEDDTAVGVEFLNGSIPDQIKASTEVILSAGSINSPQLLMLSGIGPADHLRNLNLPVYADRPGVGQNLHDHLLAPVIYESAEPVSLTDAGTARDLASYFLLGRGRLTSSIAEAGGFIQSKEDAPAPDIQLYFAPAFYMTRGHDLPDGHGFSGAGKILKPASRGQITLRSSNPLDHPVLEPNYLVDDADRRLLIDAVKRTREVLNAASLDGYRGRELWPGSDVHSDEELGLYICKTAETVFHPVGTCRMGSDSDTMAVVDPELRVIGVDRLRVVDASIMPDITRGNTNAPTIMIAERGADLIRQDA